MVPETPDDGPGVEDRWPRGRKAELAATLANLATQLQAQIDTESLLASIVAAAVEIIPGTRWAGISVINHKRVTAAVPSDALVTDLDHIQTHTGQGPALTALRDHHVVHIDNLLTETRWPDYVRAATIRGVRGILCFRLFIRDQDLGSLNLFSDTVGGFDNESISVGELFAGHAAIAMAGSAAETRFEAALASRDAIGQAKGILMQRDRLTGLEAFAVLVRASQDTQLKLASVARWLVEEHEAELKRERGQTT